MSTRAYSLIVVMIAALLFGMTPNYHNLQSHESTGVVRPSSPRIVTVGDWGMTMSSAVEQPRFIVSNAISVNQSPHEGDQLAYWKWFYGQRSKPNGIPSQWLPNALAQVHRMQAGAQTSPGPGSGTWINVGPAPESNCVTTGNECSGRVTIVAVDPTNTNTIYLGAAQGGVWKSTDGGLTWNELTDNQPSLAIGSIAVDASGIVYVGTGEGNESCDSYYGAGVLKSTDGGTTWTQLGASTFGRSTIAKIIVNGATVIVATNEGVSSSSTEACEVITPTQMGIYVSTNSGSTWSRTLSSSFGATDVVFDPSNSATVYAAVDGGIYKSTNTGSTWSGPLDGGFPTNSNVGRITLTVAPSSTSTILAAIQSFTGSDGQLYESTNGGTNWSSVTTPTGPFGGSFCNGQCWYDLVLAVDPTNPSVIYLGGQDLYRTTNGGSSWTDLGGYAGYLHPDQHAFVFSPGSNTIAFSGNDGGLWRSTSVNTCSPISCWTNLNAGLSTLQFQSLAAHPTDGNQYFGGTQDNGSPGHSGSSTVWPMLDGGDGGWTAYDRSNPSTMYHTYYYVSPARSDDGGSTWFLITTGITTSDASEFYIPMAMDPSTPTTLYLGTYRLYKTTNRGDAWSLTSPGLSLGSACNPCISAIAVAPSNGLYVYVGSSSGTFYVSTDGGNNFVERDTGLSSSFLTKIAVDPTNPQKVYVTFSGFGVGHVFVSSNAGSTWTNISSNLPDVPTNAIAVDSSGINIYVGTDIGVFFSSNGGTSWSVLGTGFPTVTVFELVFSASGILLAATHGRSVWSLSPYAVTFNTVPTSFPGASSPGSITACSGTFTNGQSSGSCGSSFSATANLPSPATGWQFSNWAWFGGVSCNSSSTNPTSCTVTSAGSLQAVFLAQITFNTNPTTIGSIIWDSCSGSGFTNGQTLLSSNFGANPICYVPSGYTVSSWSCSGELICSGSSDPTVATFNGPGTVLLTFKSGSLSNPVSTSLTASASPSNPTHGTSFTVSGVLTANGVGLGGEQIVLVFSWNTNIVTVTTLGDGSYSYFATAPAAAGPYNVDAFFLGVYSGSPQYLPSKATAMITVS